MGWWVYPIYTPIRSGKLKGPPASGHGSELICNRMIWLPFSSAADSFSR
jgi:hypothetical protein